MTRRATSEIVTAPRPTGLGQLSQEAFLEILRTAEVLRADGEELLKPVGLSSAQYNVLRILRAAGAKGLTCHQIIERMLTREPDMTRLLDRLQERGLVIRERCSNDRRVVYSCVTEAGLRLVEALDEPVAQLHAEQLGHLSEAQLRALAGSLRLVREAVLERRGRGRRDAGCGGKN